MLKYLLVAPALLIIMALPVIADDVLDTVDEAVNQYKSGDLAGAASNLDYAAQLVRQKKSELMKNLLPEPIAGWQAEEPNAQALGAALLGGGINVSRRYSKNNAVVTIDIVSDSPVLQSLVMMINNPMIAGASGGKLETINGQRAIVQYNDANRNGEVNIVVANRFMVTVKGRNVTREDVLAFAAAVDYDSLTNN